MSTNHVIAQIPADYRSLIDSQNSVTDYGYELFDELISKQLPAEVYWCGNELIAPIDWDGEIDIREIIGRAAEQIIESSDDRIWAD